MVKSSGGDGGSFYPSVLVVDFWVFLFWKWWKSWEIKVQHPFLLSSHELPLPPSPNGFHPILSGWNISFGNLIFWVLSAPLKSTTDHHLIILVLLMVQKSGIHQLRLVGWCSFLNGVLYIPGDFVGISAINGIIHPATKTNSFAVRK